MNSELEELYKTINTEVKKLNSKLRETYNDKKVIIPNGKYAGRVGIIKDIHYSNGCVICLIPPINKKNKDKFLWDSASRSYFEFNEIEKSIF